ncbi:MerR family transcriptional regulator [Saccharothrix coeruleofusca]|uniref:HTH-type transcriptional regulator SkgA n=1 Tax=Saccharothrix coeruleofusca TaxID=33919 RepID=A0A918EDF4_9PSEU|nr:TipAS antibiotic-recognition domain-containing protein [Saccharothrix coeruleofusca]MBP2339570.1 DNA-binding transcriptional MerR regulator [Saccharothrix coeruleofusca]GGP56768.1 HTH-type transcriptional regulator SkgA [Saccharothrix coeruleofusca]
MAWSITEVARMSKVTSRTLRHYDAIGLLTPAHVGSNGYRYYEREQLLRLQQILLLRDLGLGLDAVAEVLDGRHRVVDVLRAHHAWLRAEQERLARLASTVARTIEEVEGGAEVDMAELFDGIDADRQARYEAQLVERFGEGARQHIDEGRRRMRGWTKADASAYLAEWEDITRAYAELSGAGVAVDAPRALELTDRHYRWICRSWTPDRESYTGLGRLYVDEPEFRAQLDAHAEGVAEYARDAIAAYARVRL